MRYALLGSLRSEYGFTCHCHRCVVEFAAEDEANEATSPNESVHPASLASAEQAGVSTTYIGLYLLKHVCPDCGGTLAPILQVARIAYFIHVAMCSCTLLSHSTICLRPTFHVAGFFINLKACSRCCVEHLLSHMCSQSTSCICNRCGGQQTDAEFMERAEAFFAES